MATCTSNFVSQADVDNLLAEGLAYQINNQAYLQGVTNEFTAALASATGWSYATINSGLILGNHSSGLTLSMQGSNFGTQNPTITSIGLSNGIETMSMVGSVTYISLLNIYSGSFTSIEFKSQGYIELGVGDIPMGTSGAVLTSWSLTAPTSQGTVTISATGSVTPSNPGFSAYHYTSLSISDNAGHLIEISGLNYDVIESDTAIINPSATLQGALAGNDTIGGGTGSDWLPGFDGGDTLFGYASNDILDGGAGNDTLDGGTEADTLIGGIGDDIYVVDNVGDVVVENLNEGIDSVRSSIGYTLGANIESLTLTGGAIDGAGNTLDNVLTGNSNNNILTGGGGNDVFEFAASGNGIDTINDFAVGDSITISGASFFFPVVAGDGSTVLANRIQLAATGGVTTLFIGTDAVAGADVQVKLAGTFSASDFSVYGNQIFINSLPTGSVSISGVPFVGYTLTASSILADADGLGVIGYAWYADGLFIHGAISDTYIPTQVDVGKNISVAARYFDGRGTFESVSSNGVTIVKPPTSKYFVTQSAGDNLVSFERSHGGMSQEGQEIVYTGTNGVDHVSLAPGVKLDFTKSNSGIDNLYLGGNLADYTASFTTSTLTLTRGVGATAEKVILAKGIVTNYDLVVFADGAASTFDLHAWASGGTLPVLAAAPAKPTALNATIKGFALDAAGEVLTGPAAGVNFIATGGNGVDIVYVESGSTVDASKLNGGEDKIYFTGNWADYSKVATSSKITFTGTGGETVTVAAATGASNDRLVFADGYVLSNDAKTALLADTGAALSTIAGYSTAEITPLGAGSTIAGTAAAETLTGTAAGEVIYGNGGADLIDGGAGADQIVIADADATAAGSATVRISAIADGTDSVIGFNAAPVANGGDMLDLSPIANLVDAVATGQTLTTDFLASNVFIFDATPVAIADAAVAIAADISVVATDGYIVIADAANANAVTVYHSTDLANNGVETALAVLSGVDITQLTAANFLV